MTNHRWLQHLIYAPIGLILAFLIVAQWQVWERDRVQALPGSDWFDVAYVSVPDFKVGTDPIMSYQRTIKKPFVGRWFVEIREVGTARSKLVCDGKVTNHYDLDDALPDPVTLSWFVGKDCGLQPGQYQIFSTWQIERDGIAATVSVSKASNVFRVLP